MWRTAGSQHAGPTHHSFPLLHLSACVSARVPCSTLSKVYGLTSTGFNTRPPGHITPSILTACSNQSFQAPPLPTLHRMHATVFEVAAYSTHLSLLLCKPSAWLLAFCPAVMSQGCVDRHVLVPTHATRLHHVRYSHSMQQPELQRPPPVYSGDDCGKSCTKRAHFLAGFCAQDADSRAADRAAGFAGGG